tara:strand:+ start:7295 stop:11191 length:3897 start_codon:yes stop_codon:yes gene_type:complete
MDYTQIVSPKILAIKGSKGLPESKKIKLLKLIKKDFPALKDVETNEIFFIELNSEISSSEPSFFKKLDKVLSIKNRSNFSQNFYINIPRIGTISPWSSKATEILKNCGFKEINRIERGLMYSFPPGYSVSSRELKRIEPLLYDKMTQQLISNLESVKEIFKNLKPADLLEIKLNEKGIDSLHLANNSLGLALNEQEIEYLESEYSNMQKNPTDAELMMFAQANSEHCRHKIFNASWSIDQTVNDKSLFSMIKNTYKQNSKGILSAYEDNAAVFEGHYAERFYVNSSQIYEASKEKIHTVIKVETHNHPTAISPFPGASTGSGGEIRDEGACGVGSKPKAGLCGFSVSNLRIPNLQEEWEIAESKPDRIASPLDIMIEAPLGAAAFNNEFGRPNILGYFRSFEVMDNLNNKVLGYHKPIMLAGGLGNIKEEHISKKSVPAGSKLIVLGGPSMLIGLGGGSASSISSGSGDVDLDFASVQRENPEMQRRCQEVLDRCWENGEKNPILFIHDVGAGGLSNAVPELVKDCGKGGIINLRKIPNSDMGMSPMEIWCNESQERYVLAIAKESLKTFELICKRERCPYAVIGEVIDESRLSVFDELKNNYPIDIALDTIFGNTPKTHLSFTKKQRSYSNLELSERSFSELLPKILRHPSVGSKKFLITIGDRTVTGQIHRDQLVGPWQVPVADNSITNLGFNSDHGEAMSIGEKAPCAVSNPAASAKLAVAEAITNIISSGVKRISDIRLSANWMGSPGVGSGNQDLFEAVKAVGMDLCPKWGITIPVGKDSLSMSTSWEEGNIRKNVVSPLSLVISAFSPIDNINISVTPEIKRIEEPTELIFIDLGKGKRRLGGSVLSQILQNIYGETPDVECEEEMTHFVEIMFSLLNEKKVLAYHDRSDGGLITTLLEMAFCSRLGLDISCELKEESLLEYFFNEELGVVVQIKSKDLNYFRSKFEKTGIDLKFNTIAKLRDDNRIVIKSGDNVVHKTNIRELLKEWNRVSNEIQLLRDNPKTASQEQVSDEDIDRPGIMPKLYFDVPSDFKVKTRPQVAILREQGINGHNEMAAAFSEVGFSCQDLHMTDIINKKAYLNQFEGVVACGGFSYGDVLGAGRGWANTILYNDVLRTQFEDFFSNTEKFTLGICNGCQMLANLKEIIPGADEWPKFDMNSSERFEARLVQVKISSSDSVFFKGMKDSIIPIPVAHGEGKLSSNEQETKKLMELNLIPLNYVDDYGKQTESYPYNPNGSFLGAAGLTNSIGNVTIMMPHPERAFLKKQFSFYPDVSGKYSPWIKFFSNARKFID